MRTFWYLALVILVGLLAAGCAPSAPLSLATPTLDVSDLTPPPSARARATSTPWPTVAPLPPGPVVFFEKTDASLWAASGDGQQVRQLTDAPALPLVTPTPRPPSDSGSGPGPFPGPRVSWAAAPHGRAVAVVEGRHEYDGVQVTAHAELSVVTTRGERRLLLPLIVPGPRSTDRWSAYSWIRSRLAESPPGPAWSPDDRHVAVVSAHEGQYDLYTVDVTSGEVKRLTHDVGRESSPVWSPDGQWIAYALDYTYDLLQDGLHVVRADGSPPNRTLDPGRGLEGTPLWIGPDTLIWQTRTDYGRVKELRRVTLDGQAETLFPDKVGDLEWNAERRQLAFTYYARLGPYAPPHPADFGAYVLSLATGQVDQVYSGPVSDVAWSPTDRETLAFRSLEDRTTLVHLWRDGETREISRLFLASRGLLWSPDGQRLAVGGYVIRRDGSQEAELAGNEALAWTAGGLVYQGPGAFQSPLYIWDGQAARRVADDVSFMQGRKTVQVVTPPSSQAILYPYDRSQQ